MRHIRLILEYDGTGFVGWQRQRSGRSIQEELERALRSLTGQKVTVRGAGRTDAGVHAISQVVTFRIDSALPIHAFVRGTNAYLPESIAVRDAAEVEEGFDARHSASGKLYRYQIWNAVPRSPLRARTHWHVRHPLDLALMREAAALMRGRRDFAAFRASDCERSTTVRLVRGVEVRAPEPSVLHIEVEATAFLKNMVRIMVGTLVEVGRGRMSARDVEALFTSLDRTRAGPTAPAHGLFLLRVDYGERSGA